MMKRIPRISQEITKLYRPAVCMNKHTGNKLLRHAYTVSFRFSGELHMCRQRQKLDPETDQI